LVKGETIFAVEKMTQYLVPELIYTKGSDASAEHDEEPPPEVKMIQNQIFKSGFRKLNTLTTKRS
jgi:hypothetical protein